MSAYKKWQCQNCGWIYDESKGWPEDGILPGTRWEDIPEDWYCPECGAAKQDFSMLEIGADTTQASLASNDGFRIWECMVCGWTYNEAEGCPQDGIAPGTRWEDIPDEWNCPQCGVSKQEFDMVLVGQAPIAPSPSANQNTTTTTSAPLVIIGTGLAGYNLAREFRKLTPQSPLLLITADDGAFYSKPLLSASFSHGKTAQQLSTSSAEDMASELNAQILVHTRVIHIDRQNKTLTIQQDGAEHVSKIPYGKLVLATGAKCRKLPHYEGDAQSHIFRINNLRDYHRFRTAVVGRKRILLLGAGLIGCEFANDLIQTGFAVDLVDMEQWPLATLLPEVAGRDLQTALEDYGVRFHGGSSLNRIEKLSTGFRAQLSSGEQIEADVVLAALGLEANTGLASMAGIAVQRGIAVDRYLQTSDPDIYALGDCAEIDGHRLLFVAPLISCAKSLAQTLSGNLTPVCFGVIPVAVKTTLHPTTVCPPSPDTKGTWQINIEDSGVCAEFRDEKGNLLGFALTGSAIALRERLSQECQPIMNDQSKND
ncbi:FAD-dependent oxidoreductase [Microbulbifer sp. EKSA008]|uniref:FAD-dependent oxidoreductase n=1 Tax=Microbulbifer sp. EKSA008 TaxID=3243367 RepID=UPI004040F85F